MTVRKTDAAVVTEARRMTAVGMDAGIRRAATVETRAEAHRAVTVMTVAVAHRTAAVETSMEILRAAAVETSAKAHRAAAIETHAGISPAAVSGTNAEARSTARKRMYIKNADKTVKERSCLSIAALFFDRISVLYREGRCRSRQKLALKGAAFPEERLTFSWRI